MTGRRRWLLAPVLLSFAWVAPLVAQGEEEVDEVIAFGDSITRGDKRWDTQNRGGYPGRLQAKMRQTNPAAVVHNSGRDGETTAQGLSRVTSVLQELGGQVFFVMEGTNDINRVVEGEISFQSIESNLAGIGGKAANAGLEVYYATLLPRPPDARIDRRNTLTFALSRGLRDLAHRQSRGLVDVYERYFFEPGAFNRLYAPGDAGGVGHPNPAGFELLAQAFFDAVRDLDTLGPVPGELTPGFLTESIDPGTEIELFVYDHGAGIDRDNITLTINGVPVETESTGNNRRRVLTHTATEESLGCYTRLGILAQDLADPPNVTDRTYKEYLVEGGQILKGDLNRSCRVDGADLLIIAFALGSRDGEPRYSRLADINNDGVVNGMDVAEFAGNFGKSSS